MNFCRDPYRSPPRSATSTAHCPAAPQRLCQAVADEKLAAGTNRQVLAAQCRDVRNSTDRTAVSVEQQIPHFDPMQRIGMPGRMTHRRTTTSVPLSCGRELALASLTGPNHLSLAAKELVTNCQSSCGHRQLGKLTYDSLLYRQPRPRLASRRMTPIAFARCIRLFIPTRELRRDQSRGFSQGIRRSNCRPRNCLSRRAGRVTGHHRAQRCGKDNDDAGAGGYHSGEPRAVVDCRI